MPQRRAWAKGSFLDDPRERTVAQIALNLLEGASQLTRAQQLRAMGVPVPAQGFSFRPRHLTTDRSAVRAKALA